MNFNKKIKYVIANANAKEFQNYKYENNIYLFTSSIFNNKYLIDCTLYVREGMHMRARVYVLHKKEN